MEQKDNIVEFAKVSKIFLNDYIAINEIDLEIKRGEFVFIAGASGAGKSTMLKLLYGRERCSSGVAKVAGLSLSNKVKRNELALLRRKIGVVYQDYKLLLNKTVIENVTLPLEVCGVDKVSAIKYASKMLAVLDLAHKANTLAVALSGGEQQRVSIARALVNKPELIVADEPSGNLDPDMTIGVFNLLLEANRCGTTVVVASHDLALIEEINRRTIVLGHGKIIGDFQHPRGRAVSV